MVRCSVKEQRCACVADTSRTFAFNCAIESKRLELFREALHPGPEPGRSPELSPFGIPVAEVATNAGCSSQDWNFRNVPVLVTHDVVAANWIILVRAMEAEILR